MISFRYHVFTIVAIFLAVALGIAVGNAYVQPALVNQLRNRTDYLLSSNAEYRAAVHARESEITDLEASGDVLAVLDPGRMADRPVVVVTQDGTDPDVLGETLLALNEAQADAVAVLSVTDRILPSDGHTDPDLASIVGLPPSAPAEDVAAKAADMLAERLVAGPRRAAEGAGTDVLDELLRGQYLRFGQSHVQENDLANVGGRGETIVVVSGSPDGLELTPESFAVPFVDSLVHRGASVGAGEAASSVDAFVDLLRGEGGLDGSTLVTVDDLGYPVGGAALVLGLERASVVGQGGDYGVHGNAEAPIPPVPPVP